MNKKLKKGLCYHFQVIHDGFYQEGKINRKDLDLWLLRALKSIKCNIFKRYAIYFTIRLFAKSYYLGKVESNKDKLKP